MKFPQVLARINGEAKLNELAEEIAHDCRHTVWQRVGAAVVDMPSNQARGYARARCAGMVRRKVEEASRQRRRATPAWQQKLTARATDAVVRLVLAQRQAIPAAVPVRRAA